jgi:hypothetical protein
MSPGRPQVPHKQTKNPVVPAFDYAVGQVVEIDMPARLVDRQVLDEEQIAAVVDAVLAVEKALRLPHRRGMGSWTPPPGTWPLWPRNTSSRPSRVRLRGRFLPGYTIPARWVPCLRPISLQD